MHPGQRGAGDALMAVERRVGRHQVGEAGEVERDLGLSVLAGVGQRGGDHGLEQPVRGVLEPAHRVERQPAAMTQEAQERARLPVGVAGEDVEVAGVLGRAPEPVHRHREPLQARLLGPPGGLGALDPLDVGGGQPRGGGDLDRPAAVGHAVDRLAQLAHRAALEREGGRVDDRLRADPQRPQPERAVVGEVLIGGGRHHDLPSAGVGVGDEGAQDPRRRARRADRVAGDDRRLAQRAVGEHAPVRRRRTPCPARSRNGASESSPQVATSSAARSWAGAVCPSSARSGRSSDRIATRPAAKAIATRPQTVTARPSVPGAQWPVSARQPPASVSPTCSWRPSSSSTASSTAKAPASAASATAPATARSRDLALTPGRSRGTSASASAASS